MFGSNELNSFDYFVTMRSIVMLKQAAIDIFPTVNVCKTKMKVCKSDVTCKSN